MMVRRRTILLLIPHLGGGGAERVISHLARSLRRDRFDVHLGVVTRGDASTEEFPPSVRIHRIGAKRVLLGAVGIVRLVWLVKPDLILSGMFHLNFLVLLLRPLFPSTTRILVRQNGMLSGISGQTRFLYRKTYSRADGIIAQTHAMADELREFLGTTARVHVLRNPVDIQGIRRTAENPAMHQWAGPGPHLLAMGRLAPEKGFDLLLESFAVVRKEHPGADLAILGDGAERASLHDRCAALGLGTSVRFEGYVAEPASWFAGATLLVVPSRSEAFSNALLEGAAAGLPIVATPCSAGVTDLIRGQAGIWLARAITSAALARSLKAALATLPPRKRFEHSWLAPFTMREAVGKFETLIVDTLSNTAGETSRETCGLRSASGPIAYPAQDDPPQSHARIGSL